MDVAFHTADHIVVDLHQGAIFQLAILLSARVQLNLAVEGSDLLDLS